MKPTLILAGCHVCGSAALLGFLWLVNEPVPLVLCALVGLIGVAVLIGRGR